MKAFVLSANGIGKENEILMKLETSDINYTENNKDGEFSPCLNVGISPPNVDIDQFTKDYMVVEKNFFMVLIENYIAKGSK